MRLYKRLQTESRGRVEQRANLGVVEIAEEQERCVGARLAGGPQVVLTREEPLREERQRRGRSSRTEIVPGAPEALVDEDRDRRGTCTLVRCGQRGRVGVRA